MKFTFNFLNNWCEAILLASFLLAFVAEAVVQISSPLTFASTKKVPPCFEVGNCRSQLWCWQSSCSSRIGLSCKSEKLMIRSKMESIMFQAWFKSKPLSKRMAPIQDSTKSPRAWINREMISKLSEFDNVGIC